MRNIHSRMKGHLNSCDANLLRYLFPFPSLFAVVNVRLRANAEYRRRSAGGAPTIRSSSGYWAICGNNGLLLTSSSPTGNTWFLDGQMINSSSASIGVTQPGNYTVVVTDAMGLQRLMPESAGAGGIF